MKIQSKTVINIEIYICFDGFNAAHTHSYSIIALQEMNLAYRFPIIFWNTANLIVDTGGIENTNISQEEEEENDNENEETNEDNIDISISEDWETVSGEDNNSTTIKKDKTKTVDYGKLASSIGKFKEYGIQIYPPNINASSFSFTPQVNANRILFGLRGIARLSIDNIRSIINNRPYSSLQDCLIKTALNKTQIINLIKAGAFDEIEAKPREQIMSDYLNSITEKKTRLTLQNMPMLIQKKLITADMEFYVKLFLFNKFLKEHKQNNDYILNAAAINFIAKNFSLDLVDNGVSINQKTWDNLYKKKMEPMRAYLKQHETEILTDLNNSLYQELVDKYAQGNISSWEMEALSFYYHDHELEAFKNKFDNFFDLSEEPEISYSFIAKSGQEVNIYKLHSIIGTVIDKDKLHNTITLLTPSGVVLVKIYKNQYAQYDKQISQRDTNGVKHVIEPSWFKRGTLLRVQGIRRGDNFIPKTNKASIFPILAKSLIPQMDNLLINMNDLVITHDWFSRHRSIVIYFGKINAAKFGDNEIGGLLPFRKKYFLSFN